MNFAVCTLSAIPIRRLPSDKSEMVSQVLFGEVVQILKQEQKNWSLIRCEWDGYMGWISTGQLHQIDKETFMQYRSVDITCAEIVAPALSDGLSRHIPFGASLPGFDEMTFKMLGHKFAFGGRVSFPQRIENVHEYLKKMAMRLLHVPYMWGGRSPMGIDCSGFMQVIYKHIGIALPRDAYQQVEEGETVDFNSLSQIGDLAFFRTAYSDKISHVGLILEKGKIIHASERVRIDKLDHYGIFNKELNKYTHLVTGIKRILPTIPE